MARAILLSGQSRREKVIFSGLIRARSLAEPGAISHADLAGAGRRALLSQAVFPGVIQLPPDGHPICLGADSQTVGGYPILGVIPAAELWKCGQALPGSSIRLIDRSG